jgi:lipopolysaccharide/colanic/teichoic acid biosynthesis glycosyltransferase
MREPRAGLTRKQAFLKRSFDFTVSFIGLAFLWWIIVFCYILASIDTHRNGFFVQKRVGRWGRPFFFIKLRTMRVDPSHQTTVTTDHDPRITRLGRLFRKTKLDELPQLIHVLFGQMSFVGPRPDVPGFADNLKGEGTEVRDQRSGGGELESGVRGQESVGREQRVEGGDRIILSVRPGITGPATLKYRDEEAILAEQDDPKKYNDEILWPDKVRLNREYVKNWSFWGDMRLILKTISRKS